MHSLEEQLTMSEEDLHTAFWAHDPTHLGFAMTPLCQSFLIPSIDQAFKHIIGPDGNPFKRGQVRIYHGYAYDQVGAEGVAADPQQRMAALETMRPRFNTLRQDFDRIVETELLPGYRELDEKTKTVRTRQDALNDLAWLVELNERFWTIHMQIVMPVFAAQEWYEGIFLQAFPDRTASDAHALLVGASNKFVETDRALAALAERIRERPTLRRALEDSDPMARLALLPEATEFLTALESTLDQYGWRVGVGHDFYQPTWYEDPRLALSTVRQCLMASESFEERWQVIVSRQREMLAETLTALGVEWRGRFREAFDVAWALRPIDEDHHFYIDAMLPAKSRPLLMKIGAILQADGLLASPDQIFFLYRDELEALLAGTKTIEQGVLTSRQVRYHQYYEETPPPTLGTPIEPRSVPKRKDHASELKGVAASAGVFDGRARIIRSPEDFSRLNRGEVLIARTTTPSWSGLFATAGAVVTNSGGILSHAATVAREYGVPCVVAVSEATERIGDGDLVRVDGSLGMVTILHSKA
jgi:phosphohistidine swiveling domain-containing protein